MALLKELKQKRIDILKKISENQNLCKLLYYTQDNPLSMPDVTQPFETLFMKRIFPLRFIPSLTTDVGAYLLCYFGEIRGNGNVFKDTQIKFAILCHRDSWLIEDFEIRPDAICEELEALFNSSPGFGLGKLKYEYRRDIPYNDKFTGYEMCYSVTDFN